MGMKRLRKPGLAFLFAWITGFMVCGNAHPVSAKALDFAVIQPGQPGNSDQAQPVMDALALYLQKKLGDTVSIKGHYFNKLRGCSPFPGKDSNGMGYCATWVLLRTSPTFRNGSHCLDPPGRAGYRSMASRHPERGSGRLAKPEGAGSWKYAFRTRRSGVLTFWRTRFKASVPTGRDLPSS